MNTLHGHSEQELQKTVEQCVAQLRQSAAHATPESLSTSSSLLLFQRLAREAAQQKTDHLRQLAEGILRFLQQRVDSPLSLQQIEVEGLLLAAAALEQCGLTPDSDSQRIEKLVSGVIYNFDLLERLLDARNQAPAHALNSATMVDLFSDDPALTTAVSASPEKRVDPFADDPGFDPLLDLLQRTLHRTVALANSPGSDPFADDGPPSAEPSLTASTSDSDQRGDPFAEDPLFED